LALHKIPTGFGLRLSFLPLLSRRILSNRHFQSYSVLAGVTKTVGRAPGLYGVRRQAKRDAALHMAVADTFNRTLFWLDNCKDT
jgi:hypothetical protein